jgi:hypothetical protein
MPRSLGPALDSCSALDCELTFEHVHDLVAVVMEMKHRLCLDRNGLLEHPDCFAGVHAKQGWPLSCGRA